MCREPLSYRSRWLNDKPLEVYLRSILPSSILLIHDFSRFFFQRIIWWSILRTIVARWQTRRCSLIWEKRQFCKDSLVIIWKRARGCPCTWTARAVNFSQTRLSPSTVGEKNRNIPFEETKLTLRSLQCTLHAHSDLLHHGAGILLRIRGWFSTWRCSFVTFRNISKASPRKDKLRPRFKERNVVPWVDKNLLNLVFFFLEGLFHE